MCIAVVTDPGYKVPVDILGKCIASNKDGGGMAFVKEDRVVIRKGFFVLADFLDAYNEIFEQYGKDNNMLIHFRIATTGKVGAENCHPYALDKGKAALIHNGWFNWALGGTDANLSDTRELVGGVFNNFNYADALAARDRIGQIIGSNNKIATLHADGGAIIFNKVNWYKHEGAWYSHRGPIPYVPGS